MFVRMSQRSLWSRKPLSCKALSCEALPRAIAAVALLALGTGLSGCASSQSDIGGTLSLAFVDPARYDLYDCKQLQIERKSIADRLKETKRLMDKADTGFAGPVVAEIAYRNDYVAAVGQAKLADEAWKRNNCHEVPLDPLGAAPGAANAPGRTTGKHGPSRAGNAVY
jgi:hypothetical protein